MKDGPIKKITGPLSPIQLREVMARMSYAASLVSTKPQFFTTLKDGFPAITAKIPKFVKTQKGDGGRLGALMDRLCSDELKTWDIENKDYILETLKQGRRTFIFDETGAFIGDSMDKIE